MTTTAADLRTLTSALSQQKSLYQQLLALARQQSEFVANGQSEELMSVLAARSRLIDEIAPLDLQLQPYKGRWQEVLDSLAPADREPIATLLRDVQQLLGQILAQDEIDRESLNRQKTQIGSELNRTVHGAVLNKAYGVKPRVGSVFG